MQLFVLTFLAITALSCSKNEAPSSGSGASKPKDTLSEDASQQEGSTTQARSDTEIADSGQQDSNPLDFLGGIGSGGGSASSPAGGATPGLGAGNGANGLGAPAGNPDELMADKRLAAPFVSFHLNEAKENYLVANDQGRQESSMYTCPGDGLLVGQRSRYDKEKRDRRWQQSCQYFTDGRGYPLIRKNCKASNRANSAERKMDFQCPAGTFIAGHQSTFQSSSKDRIHRFMCCEMYTADNRRVKFLEAPGPTGTPETKCDQRMPYQPDYQNPDEDKAAEGVNVQVNRRQGYLHFQCSANAVIKKVKSDFHEGYDDGLNDASPDRRFSYECCELGIEGVEPPAPSQSGGYSY